MAYSGSSLAAPHPTIANLYPMITDSFNSNLMLFGYCTGAPDTTADVFEHGCILIRIDSGTGNKAIYENVGSSSVPSWNLIGDITASEITLATGKVLIGNASGVAAAQNLYGSAAARTNGATLVPLMGNPVGFAGSLTAIEVIAQDDANGTITVTNNGATVATIAKGSINSVRGSGTTVNVAFAATGSINAVTDGGAATVIAHFTTGAN